MTEGEWLCSENSGSLLRQAGGGLSQRKMRLLLCAFCRGSWDLFAYPLFGEIVERTEKCAEGIITTTELHQFVERYEEYLPLAAPVPGGDIRRIRSAIYQLSHFGTLALSNATDAAHALVMARNELPHQIATLKAQCHLLRDIVGNPFRPTVVMDPAWRTPTAISLALAAWDERELPSGYLDNVRLTVLADALEEAGCSSSEILDHLRNPGPHVRGCWALDLILGKS